MSSRDLAALRPLAVGIGITEALPGGTKLRWIMRLLVSCDAEPVERFGPHVGTGMTRGHLLIPPGRLVELLTVQMVPTRAERQPGHEIPRLKKSLHAVVDRAALIGEHNSRRPGNIILLHKLRIFFDLHTRWYEVFLDKMGHVMIRIRHGIHGNAALSLRRGAKIQEHGLALTRGTLLGLAERQPGDCCCYGGHCFLHFSEFDTPRR